MIELRNPLNNNPEPACGFFKSKWEQLCEFALMNKMSIYFRQIIVNSVFVKKGVKLCKENVHKLNGYFAQV